MTVTDVLIQVLGMLLVASGVTAGGIQVAAWRRRRREQRMAEGVVLQLAMDLGSPTVRINDEDIFIAACPHCKTIVRAQTAGYALAIVNHHAAGCSSAPKPIPLGDRAALERWLADD